MADTLEIEDVLKSETSAIATAAAGDRLIGYDADAPSGSRIKYFTLTVIYNFIKGLIDTAYGAFVTRWPTWSEVTDKPMTFQHGYITGVDITVSSNIATMPHGPSDGVHKIYKITVPSGGVQLNFSTNPAQGLYIIEFFIASASEALTLETGVFRYAEAPVLSATEGMRDVLVGYWDGTFFNIISFTAGLEDNAA